MDKYAILNTCIGGSTGKIAEGLYDFIRAGGKRAFFCYGREDRDIREDYYKIDGFISTAIHLFTARVLGLPNYGSYIATKRLIRFLVKHGVTKVYIVSIHGYYLNEKLIFSYFKEHNIKVVYIMVDEYAFLGKCGYAEGCENYKTGCKKCPQVRVYPKSFFINGSPLIYELKRTNYEKVKDMIFVGPAYTVAQAKKSTLLKDRKIYTLDEAIDTRFFNPRDCDGLRKELGISDEQIVLVCVAPYSLERKGCKYFVELARRFEGDSKYVFVHVGFNVPRASVDLPDNYIAVGFLKDQESLAKYYSLGDLFVFPSVSDTMPNACLEALSCGTPLLCFNISGMPYIADETVATFVEPCNVDSLVEVVSATKKEDDETVNRCRQYALSRYDNQKYFTKLAELEKQLD